ncbi:MAG: hypothetical protein GX050_10930 [Firmicutes bacterium]|nr:hypothetical protein [Bacillota bacterium]
MKKTILSVRWILLFLLLLGLVGRVTGEERLQVLRVKDGFNLQQDLAEWAQKSAGYHLYSSGDGLSLRLYTGLDEHFLYLGFAVKDPFLTFQDDYSLDFQKSDHLRVTLFSSAREEEAVTLYLLPTSKIREPLFNISGGSLQRQAVKVHSILNKDSYFIAVALSLDELELTPRRGVKLPLQIMINDLTKSGEVRKYWVFSNNAHGYGLLYF